MRLTRFAALAVCAASLFAASLPDSGISPNAFHASHGRAAEDRSVSHEGRRSVRLDPGDASATDAIAASPNVALQIGHWYDLTGWVRTEGVDVVDSGRSPIAVGATLGMASMPPDVHAESLGGTREWTRLRLRFQATSTQDQILLLLGRGGHAAGKAWFSDVRVEDAGPNGDAPTKASVRTFGPAYRYPARGWTYLHIEGEPYERGYQHGYLMAREIVEYLDRCASQIDTKDRPKAWEWARTMSNALFLRGFDEEIRTEMKGIADGAAAAGAKWEGRKVDLTDIVAANTITELDLLHAAMPMTPTGLESVPLHAPSYFDKTRDVPVTERCSAFAATGPATRDGKMMIAHITMWPLTLAEQTNVMLDVQPAKGHRVLMQSYPGGIQSGTDWYQNDVGVVLTETTIRQSPFNVEGLPVAFRARKSIQYGDNIDKVVEYLGTKNNGMYTNEWLIADARTNEIAMYELGTYKTKLYRSSKGDWFGNTAGFYWGDNNAKDLNVRLEYAPDPQGAPAYLPYVPNDRDLKWMELYRKNEGRIDPEFAFGAFRTPPLVTSSAMDAKVVNSDMAKNMMVWGFFGRPNEREWTPGSGRRGSYERNAGLYPGGYHLFAAQPSPALAAEVKENEEARVAKQPEKKERTREKAINKDLLWKGWILPASDDDTWFTAGSALYYRALESNHFDRELDALRTSYRTASLAAPNAKEKYTLAASSGALRLHALRQSMGDDAFFALMKKFFAENTTKTVHASDFTAAAGAMPPLDLSEGPIYAASELRPLNARIGQVVIVYGTLGEAGANRYAAEELQKKLLGWYESEVPIHKDFEVVDATLRDHDVIFVGRPETNSALAAWQSRIGLTYEGTSFRAGKTTYATEEDALVFTAANPLDAHHMALVVAGNSPLETVRIASLPFANAHETVYRAGKEIE